MTQFEGQFYFRSTVMWARFSRRGSLPRARRQAGEAVSGGRVMTTAPKDIDIAPAQQLDLAQHPGADSIQSLIRTREMQ